jgi:hypothetical protein
MDHGELREEFGVDAPFVGQRRDRPTPSFRVGRDVYAGYFVILRPSDGDKRPFLDCEGINKCRCRTGGTSTMHTNSVLEAFIFL